MSDKTIIAWTDRTFNPWWGCSRMSAGCKNCYAADLAKRYGFPDLWKREGDRRVFGDEHWKGPLKWNEQARKEGKRLRVFCGSMMDWAEDHPVAEKLRPRLWALIRATPLLDWQLLTKRPERILECLPQPWSVMGRPMWPNVWLGTSIEDARVIDRAEHLRRVPAAVRFVSYEPALGPLDDLDLRGLHWIIYGGESGPHFRPHDLDWARVMREKCRAAGVAFFYKQSAARRTEMGTTLDGETVREYPKTETLKI